MAKNNYEIPAKPTYHNDILYRSRLEAKFACFFDFLGWEFEYEPEPFTTWSPDFALHAIGGVFIEVKPSGLWCDELIDKIKPYASIRSCLFSGELSFDNDQFYLGKIFNKDYETEPLLLKDLAVPYHNRFTRRLVQQMWNEAQNKVMYLRPDEI